MQRKSTGIILRILLLISICLPAVVAADTTWTHLQTENFEMYTTAGEKRGREAILYFEQVHALFAQMFKAANASKLPVRIVAFRNEKEFAPFRPGQAAAAFYGSGLERDYIVMQSITSENYPIAVHEYMHRIVNSMGLTYPVWLNEGIAELFATLKPVGNKVQMGMMDINRATVLRTNKMIPLPAFMAVDEKSPIYNERDKAGIFYAQSFALAHMLYFGNEAEFGKLQQAFQKSKDPKEAFLTAYGLTLEAVQRDLEKYMNQNRFFYGVVNVKLEKSEETAEVRPVDDFEVKIMLADLYRINRNWTEAARVYEEAAKLTKDRPETEEGLGWLALYQQKSAEALPHFVKAIELGSKRPLVYQNASMLSWGDTTKALAYMKQALALDPDLKDGNYNLGTLAMNAQDPKLALESLNRIKKVTPDRASGLFRTKAHAYLALNNLDEAKKNAALAKQYAKTDVERTDAANVATYIAQREEYLKQAGTGHAGPPPAAGPGQAQAPYQVTLRPATAKEPRKETTGALLEVICQGQEARLRVAPGAGGGSPVVYLIPDPTRVEMRSVVGITHEFTCGPQTNTRVKLGFVEPAEMPAGVAGIVRSIEFVK